MTTHPGTTSRHGESPDWARAVCETRSHRGATLEQLSADRPVLVVFLRHTGCVFCRESLGDLSRQRAALEAAGVGLALVHMSDPLSATLRFEQYGLGDVHRYSDRERRLYAAFGLERGKLRQVFGLRVWWRALGAVLCGNWFGRWEGDGFQLPGVFLLYRGRLLTVHRAACAAERPDYVAIARRGCAAAGYCPPRSAATARGTRHSA